MLNKRPVQNQVIHGERMPIYTSQVYVPVSMHKKTDNYYVMFYKNNKRDMAPPLITIVLGNTTHGTR